MSDRIDAAMLLTLEGDQECACCGIDLSADDCDVVDGEVLCMDCVAGYHPDVFARRQEASSGA